MSRYGRMSFSLINCQMMRVISSPSSSTTGRATVIFATMRDPLHGTEVGPAPLRPQRARASASNGRACTFPVPPVLRGSILPFARFWGRPEQRTHDVAKRIDGRHHNADRAFVRGHFLDQ